MNEQIIPFWTVRTTDMLQKLETTPEGLTNDQAEQRLSSHSADLLRPSRRSDTFTILLAQFKSPIILILLFASGLSFILGDPADALIIFTIVLISALLGFCRKKEQLMLLEN